MSIQEKQLLFQEAKSKIQTLKNEIQKYIVGQDDTIDQVLWTIFSEGHGLLEGLPGLGKTMLVRTIAECLQLSFSRIQFTPDLMPSDITGTMILQRNQAEEQKFQFHQGPLFSQVVLADEINRATPKTQSALLEAMGEKTVTIMGETKPMNRPFFVLATQNPLDMEGTYPLPEAQMDRFLCKIHVNYPTKKELKEIILRTTTTNEMKVETILEAEEVIQFQNLAKEILVSDDLLNFAIQIISATHPDDEMAPDIVKNYVQYGSGPRGLQSLIRCAKTRSLFNGRYAISIGDIKQVAVPVLRHRIFLNFEGEADGIKVDDIISEVIHHIEEKGVLFNGS